MSPVSLDSIARWLRRVVTQPREELDRWQRAARFTYDLARFGARQLRQDRAQQMAAALGFRTLFGLLPVLVVATILVKAMGMTDELLVPLDKLFGFWGLDNVQIVPPTALAGDTTNLGEWMRDRVREAEQINAAAIGWVGLLITGYAAISLVVTIENSFNTIYRASQGRRWSHRVPLYWFVLTISPLLVIFSTYIDGRFQLAMTTLQARPWLSSGVGVVWSVFVIWLLMLTVYLLFPNTRVRFRPAMVGALVAAVLLEIGKRSLGMYLQNALSISQLYGSLGLIPLFMFWVYLMWMAVLFGLQVSSTLQHLQGRKIAELEERQSQSTLVEPAILIVFMKIVAVRFRAGRTTTIDWLADAVRLPDTVVERTIDTLVEAEMLHRTAESDQTVALQRPPESIRLDELLEVAFRTLGSEIDGDQARRVIAQLRKAQTDATGDQTLATLMAAEQHEGSESQNLSS